MSAVATLDRLTLEFQGQKYIVEFEPEWVYGLDSTRVQDVTIHEVRRPDGVRIRPAHKTIADMETALIAAIQRDPAIYEILLNRETERRLTQWEKRNGVLPY